MHGRRRWNREGRGRVRVLGPRLPQPRAESDSVRRRRPDAVRKRPKERLRSRWFFGPFSEGPMSFKRRLLPPRQATNELQELSLTAQPVLPGRFCTQGASRPANGASSSVLCRIALSQWFAVPNCSSPFGVGGQWGVDCSFQNEAGPAPQARPAPPHPGGVDLHPAAQAWSRPLVCVGSPRSRCSRPPLCVAQLRCADARVFSYLSPGARVPHPVTSRSLQSLLICVGADFPNLVFPFAPSSPPPPPAAVPASVTAWPPSPLSSLP